MPDLSTGAAIGLIVCAAVLLTIYAVAFVVSKNKTMRENAVVRSNIKPTPDAHLAEKNKGEK